MGIKYSINEGFFDTWSSSMAHILGFWFADGSIEDAPSMRGKYLRVTNTDKDRILLIREQLHAEHPVVRLSPTSIHGKTRYFLRFGSHAMFRSLIRHGLFPHKSLTMSLPSIPTRYFADFARGYFDGDGCVYLERSKGSKGQIITRRLTVVFTSGSKQFLDELARRFTEHIGIRKIPARSSHRSYQIRYSTVDSVKLFCLFYGNTHPDLYLRRKFAIFAQYFQLRPSRTNHEIVHILAVLKRGHVVK